MSTRTFIPTEEQSKIINHTGSAFITACPGAGKTRVMVERARNVLRAVRGGRGIAFLSFTRGAIQELTSRLRREALLPSPVFPHFLGTFDSFIWQFLISPFGIPGVEATPRLISDKRERRVIPFEGARPLPLSCFDRFSGKINLSAAKRLNFDVSKIRSPLVQAYETSARNLLTRFRLRGELDFEDARDLALARIQEKEFAGRLSAAIAGRFGEIIVDEAQDCNPSDLEIIGWLRDTGVHTKVVCDPDQSIYEFRGGVTDHLTKFADTFESRLSMRGNFRSSDNICRTIVALRSPGNRKFPDEPLGEYRHENLPVYLLSYAGQSVHAGIGRRFVEILKDLSIEIGSAPVLAATRSSCCKAVGRPVVEAREDLTFRLAEAVSNFHLAFESDVQTSAIQELHKIILELKGSLSGSSETYHQYIGAHDIKPEEWRPMVVGTLRALRYDPKVYANADEWHQRAKDLLAPYIPSGGLSIAQRLKKNAGISSLLALPPAETLHAKTIHSVKGAEFLAVCVVATRTFKGILDYLETGAPPEAAEMARELYVAASRARRLLAIAAPKSQSARFAAHLRRAGAEVVVSNA